MSLEEDASNPGQPGWAGLFSSEEQSPALPQLSAITPRDMTVSPIASLDAVSEGSEGDAPRSGSAAGAAVLSAGANAASSRLPGQQGAMSSSCPRLPDTDGRPHSIGDTLATDRAAVPRLTGEGPVPQKRKLSSSALYVCGTTEAIPSQARKARLDQPAQSGGQQQQQQRLASSVEAPWLAREPGGLAPSAGTEHPVTQLQQPTRIQTQQQSQQAPEVPCNRQPSPPAVVPAAATVPTVPVEESCSEEIATAAQQGRHTSHSQKESTSDEEPAEIGETRCRLLFMSSCLW